MGELVLLPGLICDGRLWRDTVERLALERRPMIADLTADSSIPVMAGRVLTAAPDRFALAGLSMGGYVALEIMRQAPDRVTHLALLDTSARPDDEARKQKRRDGIAAVERGGFLHVARTMLPGLLAPDHLKPLGEEVQAMSKRVGGYAYVRQQTAIMGRIDSRPSLGAIAVPTLVGVGAFDTLTPPEVAEELAAGIAGAELVTFAGSGHLSTMEAPEAVAAAMRKWMGR